MEPKTSKSPLRVLRPSQLPIRDACDVFILAKRAENKTPKTIAFYEGEFRRFLTFATAQNVTDIADVSADLLRRYVLDMQARGYKGTSQHAAFRALRSWLNWSEAQGYIHDNPFAKLSMPTQEKDTLPALSEDDVRELLKMCRTPRDAAIVLCLLDSGLRATEFCALNVGDYNKRTGDVAVKLGKGRKSRTSYFGPKARAELARYLYGRRSYTDADPLFIAERGGGGRLTVSGLEKILNRLGKRANVHVTPHCVRRTTATWAFRGGWSLEGIRRLLGHSDFTVLRRYLALDAEDVRAEHEKSPPTGRL